MFCLTDTKGWFSTHESNHCIILFTHNLWRLFTLFRKSTFFRPPSSYLLERVLCFILGLELFHKMEVWTVSKALIKWVGTGVIRAWKIFSGIYKLLKTTTCPSRVRFQNPQSFNTLCTLETIFLISYCCMRKK